MSDPLGIKPFGEAVNTTVTKTFEGVEAFLSATCKPALDELGLMLKDHVRIWRLNNILKIVEKSKNKFEFKEGEINLKANPKVALAIIENGANEDSDELQEMWAGLFITSFSTDGHDDENIIYISILKQLTSPAAKLLKYICENCEKFDFGNGIIGSATMSMYAEQISDITGIQDFNKQEVILYHLASLKLSERRLAPTTGGFQHTSFKTKPLAWLSPTNLAINLYLRCQGIKESAKEHWKIPSQQPK